MNISKSEYQLEVVNRIKDLRIKADVGQTKLANLLDVVSGQIGNIESPRYQHKYTLKQLYTISKFFDVSIEYLLTGDNTPLTTDKFINLLISYDE